MDKGNAFDDTYTDFCNDLRESGKASSFCELIKNAKSDVNRISILSRECNIVRSLIKTLKESMRNNSKNSEQARKALQLYYSRKHMCSDDECNLISSLNSALTHLKMDHELDVEQLVDLQQDERVCLGKLMDKSLEKSPTPDEVFLSEVYRERSNYFYDAANYELSLLESLRGMYYARVNKNAPEGNVFPFLILIITSLKQLNRLKASANVLQFTIQLLRISTLDNASKSQETMSLVKLLKEIQMLSKDGGGSEEVLNLKSLLEPKNENIPKILQNSDVLSGTSSSLQLQWQAERGRHMVLRETIPPGSTIIVERPYSWIIHPKHSLMFCQNCCHEVKNVVPCELCSSVVFCSKQCRSAGKAYHKYECKFMNILTSSDVLGDMVLLSYRTLCKTDLQVLVSHVREYLRLQEEGSDSEKSFHDKFVLGLDDTGKLDSSSYASVFAQTTNSDARLGGDLLKRSFSAIFLTLCLRFGGYFKTTDVESESLSDNEILIASLMLRHLQSNSCNAYGINNATGSSPHGLQINEIGGASYPIISTTNHSCNSNIYRFTIGKTCIVKTLREIQAGEEILDSYGPHFACNSMEERILHLNQQYQFSCRCSPCVENWLIYSKLPKVNPSYKCPRCDTELSSKGKTKCICSECNFVFETKKMMKIAKESEQQFQVAKEQLFSLNNNGKSFVDYQAVQNSIVRYSRALGKIEKWPSQSLVECQETLKLCWNLESRTK